MLDEYILVTGDGNKSQLFFADTASRQLNPIPLDLVRPPPLPSFLPL